MQIQLNSDDSVDGGEALERHAENVTRKALQRFGDHVTRVEIHLSDVNGEKDSDDDKHCMIEARLAGRRPVTVRDKNGSLHQALDGATRKLVRRLDSTLGRLASKRRAPAPSRAGSEEIDEATGQESPDSAE